MPAAARSPTSRSNRSSCRSVNARSSGCSPSATGRWVHTPSSRSSGSAHHRSRDGRQVLRRRAHPVHAGVDLDVHIDRPAGTRRRRAEGLDALGGVQRRREPVGQRRRCRAGVALAEQQHRCGDAVLAQLHPLVDQRDGEPPCATGQRGAGHRRASVAVAVGLDHRAQLGRRDQAGQHPRVVGDGGQVDLGPRRARATLRHGHRGVLVRRDRGHQPHRGALSHRHRHRRPTPVATVPRTARPPAPAGHRPPGPATGPAPPPARARGRPARPPPAAGAHGRRRRR